MEVAQAVSFLDDYWARNQVFRTVQFSSAMLSGLLQQLRGEGVCSQKLMVVYGAVADMRVMLRLLDDLPALLHTIHTCCRARGVSVSELVGVVCGQLYYPVEHLAWAADHKLISLDSTPVWTVAILLWGIPLLITIIKQLVQLLRTTVSETQLQGTSSSREQRMRTLLSLVQATCDLGLAVFWLPKGWLWGGKLPPIVWGLLGTISSLLGLYHTIKSKRVHSIYKKSTQ